MFIIKIALVIVAVLVVIGIFRIIFDNKNRDSFGDIFMDLLLLDIMFDVLGAIGEGLSDIDFYDD